MKTYNRIMEIFWMVLGVVTLIFASYLYFTGSETDKIGFMYVAGSMAVLLSIFRMVYRNYMNEKDSSSN